MTATPLAVGAGASINTISSMQPSITPQAVDAPHLAYLDGVRGLAALWVLLAHAWLQVWPILRGIHPTGPIAWLTGWMLYAHFAVDVFIVLSGFCLALPAIRRNSVPNVTRFLTRRALRIVPPFYLALAVSTLLATTVVGRPTGTHWDVSIPVTKRDVLANVLLVQDVWHLGKINHAFWSIAVEWRIYFLFPLILSGLLRRGPVAIAITVVVSAALTWAAYGTWLANAHPHYLALFAFGMLAADVSARRPDLARRAHPIVPLAISGSVAIACAARDFATINLWFPTLDIFVGIAAAWMLAHAFGENRVNRFLSWRPLATLGTFAYSLYLVHAPLLQVTWQLFVRPFGLVGTQALAMMLATLPLIVGAAYVFYLACERPFMPGRSRSTRRDRRVVALSPAAP